MINTADREKTRVELLEVVADLRRSISRLEKTVAEKRALEENIKLYKTLFTETDDLAYIYDDKGNILFVNRAFERLTGKKPEDFILKPFAPLFDEKTVEKAMDVYSRTLKGESPIYELAFKDSGVLCEYRNMPLRGEGGKVIGVMGIARDITARKAAEDELKRYKASLEEEVRSRTLELKKLSAAIEYSVSIVFVTDENGAIEYVNPMFETVTGFSKEEAAGKTPQTLCSVAAPEETFKEMWETVRAGGTWRGVFKNRKKNGDLWWSNAVVSPVKDELGRITHFLSVQEDITERRSSTEQIAHLAHFDALTGLMNRARFIELLTRWLSGHGPGEDRGALLLLDIDQFKFICDTYGHGLGDEFLRRIATLLKINMRYINSQFLAGPDNEGTLCRLSGDEFGVFLPSAGRAEAAMTAEQVRKGLEGFFHADVPCHLTASLGVSLYPEHGATTTELLTKADAAMYRAKELGRNRYHIYSPLDRDIEDMHARLKWKERILDALKEDRFEAWFQPIMSMKDSSITHYEVLARMREKDGGVVLPGPFIDIAERFGLVRQIAKAVIEKALRLKGELSKKGKAPVFCLNISGKELGDNEFLYYLQSKIYETGVEPSEIVFEITETASIHNMDSAIKFLKALKAMGSHISLDDFGIGFTSFLYLKEMHVDYVKIAGPFVKNLEKNLNDQLFVKAIIEVARGLSIKTIAEFVESGESLKLLKEFGIDYAQGYFVGRPVPELNI